MPIGMTDIAPVATNTTLVHKKFPVSEENSENDNFIEKYNNLLQEFQQIYDYQSQQMFNIKENTDVNNLQKLYTVYEIYDNIGQILFEFQNELQKDNPDHDLLLKDRILLVSLFDKLLVQITLYIKTLRNNTTVQIDKKSIDQYDMLIPSTKKDWLVNYNF